MAPIRFKLPIGAKRQVTIPRQCMELLGLDEGGELMLEIVGDHAVLLPVVSIPRRDLPEDIRRKFEARRGAKTTDIPVNDFLAEMGEGEEPATAALHFFPGGFGGTKIHDEDAPQGATLGGPGAERSAYTPRIETVVIPTDKIRGLIGNGGATILDIIEQTGAKIDVDDTGRVTVTSSDDEGMKQALEIIASLTAVPEIGRVYLGKVVRLAEFGAFVEIFPGTDGLLHISEIAEHRVKDVRDELREGDQVMVKVMAIEGNRIKLSRKALMKEQKAKLAQSASAVAEVTEGDEAELPAASVKPRHEFDEKQTKSPSTILIEGGADFEEVDEELDEESEPKFNSAEDKPLFRRR